MQNQTYKEKLEEEKIRLEREMGSVGRKNPAVPNDWEAVGSELGTESDPVDQANIVISHEENTAILADLEARYDTVLAALARIENGTYGKCEVDGESIEEARLNADPSATTCMGHL